MLLPLSLQRTLGIGPLGYPASVGTGGKSLTSDLLDGAHHDLLVAKQVIKSKITTEKLAIEMSEARA